MNAWPAHLPVATVRVARPTDRLAAVVDFYEHALGLPRIGEFRDHDGYDGVILGLPDRTVQLEFTTHAAGSPCPAPTKDNLLVLYFHGDAARDAVAARLRARGHSAVEPENPWWRDRAVTVEDPDGWRVVLASMP